MSRLWFLAIVVGAALTAAGCSRSPGRQSAQLAGPVPPEPMAVQTAAPAAAAGGVAKKCESALGSAMAPGLITARRYAVANLAHRMDGTRAALATQGARRFQTIRHAVRCKPSSVVLTAGRLYRCSTSAHVCGSG